MVTLCCVVNQAGKIGAGRRTSLSARGRSPSKKQAKSARNQFVDCIPDGPWCLFPTMTASPWVMYPHQGDTVVRLDRGCVDKSCEKGLSVLQAFVNVGEPGYVYLMSRQLSNRESCLGRAEDSGKVTWPDLSQWVHIGGRSARRRSGSPTRILMSPAVPTTCEGVRHPDMIDELLDHARK